MFDPIIRIQSRTLQVAACDRMTEPQIPKDVRMSGFRDRASVDQAWDWIHQRAATATRRTNVVTLDQSYGLTLAESVISPMNVPSFDRAAMDGYAVVAEETTGATSYQPVVLQVVGKSLPGQGYSCQMQSGQAVEIMTGAPLPAGANAVVPIEFSSASQDIVELSAAVSPLKHVGRTAEDLAIGDVVVNSGRILRPQDVAVLASIGTTEVTVFERQKVRIIITGNELVKPGQSRQAHQIFEANSYLLHGTVNRDGGIIESVRFTEDQPEEIATALLAPGADILLVSGGSSVGAEDYAPQLIRQHGELSIHGMRMRPSSPAGMGMVGVTPVFLLPGNPVSCLCAYDFFASRYLRMLRGDNRPWPFPQRSGSLGRKVSSVIGRTDYCRVKYKDRKVTPLGVGGAGILSSTTRADGFVIIPEMSEGLPAGSEVEVLLYDDSSALDAGLPRSANSSEYV